MQLPLDDTKDPSQYGEDSGNDLSASNIYQVDLNETEGQQNVLEMGNLKLNEDGEVEIDLEKTSKIKSPEKPVLEEGEQVD